MNDLMYEITSSDIRILELKLKRIRFSKMALKFKKPVFWDKKALKIWEEEFNELKREEEVILSELQENYRELGLNMNEY